MTVHTSTASLHHDPGAAEPGMWPFVRSPLRDLRLAGLIEGTTLVLLMGVAVPLRRMADLPEATAVMGTIHGIAVLVYFAMLLDAYAAGLIGRWVALRGLPLALVPTGTFWNDPALRRAEARFVEAQPPDGRSRTERVG